MKETQRMGAVRGGGETGVEGGDKVGSGLSGQGRPLSGVSPHVL